MALQKKVVGNLEYAEILRSFFATDRTYEQKLLKYITEHPGDVYSPIKVFDKIICEGFRNCEDQEERFSKFPDITGETLLDFGCNNGYLLIQLHKRMKLKESVGVDADLRQIFIAQSIITYERLQNIYFEIGLIKDYMDMMNRKDKHWDNIIMFGVFEFRDCIEETIIPDLIDRVNKRIIIEFANHQWDRKTKKEAEEYLQVFKKFGNIKIDFIRHQNRPILIIEK